MAIDTFEGARVAITGGATGLGQAVARRMAADGARISVCGLGETDVAAGVDALRAAGSPEVRGAVVDVTDPAALDGWIDDTVAAFGGLDVGWNNAGMMLPGAPMQDRDYADAERLLSVNLLAVYRGSQRFAQVMAAQGTPALILNTGSENSLFHGVPGGAAYVASKMAVRGLTLSLRQDVPDFVDVKLLCPGFVHTALGPDEQMRHGMDAGQFADIVYPQLTQAGRFYVVSHGFNAERVRRQTAHILDDIESGALSADATERYDTYTLMGLDDWGDPLDAG